MRRLILAAAAAFMLSGCVSYLESAYDDEARANCYEQRRTGAESCWEIVDRQRREARRARRDD